MNIDFDKNLQELLSNHTEQPSLDCWDKISSRLDAMQAANAGSAANASQFSQFAGSVIGKIALTAAIAASVAVAAYFIVSDKEESPQILHTQEITTIEQDIVSLPANDTKEEFIENRTEKVCSSDKITQTNCPTTTEAVVENTTEETVNIFPIFSVNQSDLNETTKETSPQPKETTQQQPLSTTKESVAEPTEKTETTAENKEETEEPKQPKIGIPNVITPNGDGINDFFAFINIEQAKDNQLDIFTREGKVVYSKRYYDNSWDGSGLPAGTYYYIFRFVYQGNQFYRKGSISIVR
ncbi:MAG: gliding motility-associated C-terminal domain-containing protein [Lentimicrobiaceae bacterium]|nr:gliding motility-associated C-terminal domain-containing protein [Lentimicrobiaceae bacterium]